MFEAKLTIACATYIAIFDACVCTIPIIFCLVGAYLPHPSNWKLNSCWGVGTYSEVGVDSGMVLFLFPMLYHILAFTCLEKPHNTEAAFSPAVAATGFLKTCCF